MNLRTVQWWFGLGLAALFLAVALAPSPRAATFVVPIEGGGGVATNAIAILNGGGDYTSLSNASFYGGVTNFGSYISYSNTIRITATGNPIANAALLTNTVHRASAGTKIIVGPGDYFDGTNSILLAKDGVNVHFESGANVTFGVTAFGSDFVSPFYDNGVAITSSITGHGRFIITNVSGVLLYASVAGTKIFFECDSARAMGTAGAVIGHDDGEVLFWAWDEARTDAYDVYLSQTVSPTSKIFYYATRTFAGDNWIEKPGAFGNPGDAYFTSPYVEAMSGATRSFINVVDNAVIDGQGGVMVINRTAVISGGTTVEPSTGSGVLRGYTIRALDAATNGVISPFSATYNTSFQVEDCTIYGPTNKDPVLVDLGAGNTFGFKNTRIIGGWNATNSVRSAAAETITADGPLIANLPLHANITAVASGTNYLANVYVFGGATFLGITPSRPAYINAQGTLTNASGTPDGTKFLRDDGVLAVPAGGSATPGGAQPMLQMNLGGVFVGATNLTYDNTNNRVGLNIGGARPATTFEIGGTTVPELRIGYSTGISNFINNATYGNYNDVMIFAPKATAAAGTGLTFKIDTNSLFATTSDASDLGTSSLSWRDLYLSRYARAGTVRATGTVYAASVEATNVPGLAPGAITLFATNQTEHTRIQAAYQMARSVTNIVGLWEVSDTGTLTVDCNKQHYVNKTNRLAAAISVILTNGAPGQEIKGVLLGEASGGTDRVATFIPNTGALAANSFDLAAALAANVAATVSNGYALEWNCQINKLNGTNVYNFAVGYSKF